MSGSGNPNQANVKEFMALFGAAYNAFTTGQAGAPAAAGNQQMMPGNQQMPPVYQQMPPVYQQMMPGNLSPYQQQTFINTQTVANMGRGGPAGYFMMPSTFTSQGQSQGYQSQTQGQSQGYQNQSQGQAWGAQQFEQAAPAAGTEQAFANVRAQLAVQAEVLKELQEHGKKSGLNPKKRAADVRTLSDDFFSVFRKGASGKNFIEAAKPDFIAKTKEGKEAYLEALKAYSGSSNVENLARTLAQSVDDETAEANTKRVKLTHPPAAGDGGAAAGPILATKTREESLEMLAEMTTFQTDHVSTGEKIKELAEEINEDYTTTKGTVTVKQLRVYIENEKVFGLTFYMKNINKDPFVAADRDVMNNFRIFKARFNFSPDDNWNGNEDDCTIPPEA
jgi:Holliday junction resolvase